MWTSQPSGAPGTTNSWSVLTYDTASGTTVTTIGSSTATVVAYAISGNNNLAFTVTDDTSKGSMSIYLASLDQTGLSFSDSTPPPTTLNTCDRSHPITCGQVRQYGAYFVDDGGYWPMDGVQFILPQSGGINGNTFTSSVYNAAVSDGSLEFWLGVAQNYLLAKTLRVYLYEPSENSATCLSCISDFADRANNHGMRLGVVMRNGLSQMSQADANFVNSFINTFQNRSQEIAYVAADNETNNHGGSYCPDMKDRYNREYDCFDRYAISHTHDRTYINNAMTWMRDFTGLFVNHTPRSPILLTVSISTEMGDLDGYPIENDFFRYSSTPGLYRMADYVNFLSPHDYGGAASSILATLRQNPRCWQCYSYSGPVMLEEFGWPTDDVNEAANQQDGDQTTCRNNPYDQSCSNTAPYRVEVNASAVRGFHPPLGGYAASSAFMIADINQAPCSRHNGYSNNNFDGLFTANVAYCGGTYDPYNPHGGYYKNTAFRIRTHHYYFNPHP